MSRSRNVAEDEQIQYEQPNASGKKACDMRHWLLQLHMFQAQACQQGEQLETTWQRKGPYRALSDGASDSVIRRETRKRFLPWTARVSLQISVAVVLSVLFVWNLFFELPWNMQIEPFPFRQPLEVPISDPKTGITGLQNYAEGLPSCAMNQPRAKSFLLVFMGHSGSTAIMTSLAQHSNVLIEGLEPVDHDPAILANESLAVEFADKFFARAVALNKTGGFKVRPRHFSGAAYQWMNVIRKYNTRIILNFRNNLLKQAIGHYPMKFLNSTAAYEGIPVGPSNVDNTPPPTYESDHSRLFIKNMDGLAELLRDRIKGEAAISGAMASLSRSGWNETECTLPVSYEGFLMDWQGSMGRIQSFLGLETKELHRPLRRKATKDNLCVLVENYGEVCTAFFGCQQIRWMLDDTANNCMCSRLVTGSAYVTGKYCPYQL